MMVKKRKSVQDAIEAVTDDHDNDAVNTSETLQQQYQRRLRQQRRHRIPNRSVPPFENNPDLLRHVISYIGTGQYRFVAAINHHFQEAYMLMFPDNKDTYLNASTVAHATICFNETATYDIRGHQQFLCCHATKCGNILALQYLRSINCPWDIRTCAYAAGNGHLKILQWARENGCPWSEWTCGAAAENGHLEILQWALENGCPWKNQICSIAAKHGHLEVLQWARENGCPWDELTCGAAAENGHLEVLQWARENGCPWDEETTNLAVENSELIVLQWAIENGCSWDEEYVMRSLNYSDPIAEWLRRNYPTSLH